MTASGPGRSLVRSLTNYVLEDDSRDGLAESNRLMRIEPTILAISAAAIVLAIGVGYREMHRRRLWKVLGEGLEGPYPNSELLVDYESVGKLQIVDGPKCGHARSIANEDGFWLKRIGILANGYSFRIPWSAIKRIEFTGMVYPAKYGNDYTGLATVSFHNMRGFKVKAPWRGIFDASVPDDVSLESTQVVRNAT